jgi:hypothetical protein
MLQHCEDPRRRTSPRPTRSIDRIRNAPGHGEVRPGKGRSQSPLGRLGGRDARSAARMPTAEVVVIGTIVHVRTSVPRPTVGTLRPVRPLAVGVGPIRTTGDSLA